MEGVIADTDCQSPTAAAVEVYSAASAPPLDQLERAGQRLAASGPDGRVLFDVDGQNADASATLLLSNFNAIVTAGSVGAVAASDAGAIQYLIYSVAGATLSGPFDVAMEDPVALTATWGGGAGTVTWAIGGDIRSRTLDEDGVFFGPAYDVVTGAFTSVPALKAAARDLETGVAWTADSVTSFIRTDGVAPLGSAVELLSTPTAHSVTAVASTTAGYVVLFTGEDPERTPLLMTLDATGQPTSGVWELAGASGAFDLASAGDEFAVLVERASGEVEMRAFDLNVTPLAAWACVGADRDAARRPSIVRYDMGYAVLHTSAAGSVMLRVVDHLGL
jgi:hypothetical protein